MKKNVMMRLASFLLVAVLISTSAISGTYAKYVTEGTGTDSARVAKWGVDIEVAGTMFAETYESGNETVVSAGAVNEVSKLVAPGTKGDMTNITITGTPEVDVIVNYEATKVDLNGWADKDGYYCPLVITINGTDKYYLDSYTSELEAENVIKEAIKNYSKTYEANQDLSAVAADNLDISWEWPFYVDEAGDISDTYLGDKAAEGTPATIEIEVKCTVTQID